MSTEKIITETSNEILSNGVQRLTWFKQRITTMNPQVKRGIKFYFASVLFCYASFNYYDGKQALVKYRQEYANNPKGEFNAIRAGINGYNNMWSSIIFPWTALSRATPHIILLMNPSEKA